MLFIKKNKNPVVLLLLILAVLTACDAPRENPLDPGSPYYAQARTTLAIHHLSPLMTGGIAGANIIVPRLGLFAVSDAQGLAHLYHPQTDSLYIITQTDGYFSDTSRFGGLGKLNTLTIRLNAKPEINSIDFHSLYENFDGYPAITSASFMANISDLDGQDDISVAFLRCETRPFSDTLELVQGEKSLYSSAFRSDEIAADLQPGELPELNFRLIVKNSNGDSLTRGPFSVTRVIAQDIRLLQPANGAVVSDTVFFAWQPAKLDYTFTYSLLLRRLQDNHTELYSGIAATDSTYKIANLIPGVYFWQLKIKDAAGDLCQSIYFSFSYE